MMVEIALHCVPAAPAERLLLALGRATEAAVELGLAAVGHMCDAAGQTQSEVGALWTAVVVAAGEVGVLTDGKQLRLTPGDLLGGRVRRAGQHDASANAFWVGHRPLECPHGAHRASEDCRPCRDPQPISQRGLSDNLVANGHEGESAPPWTPVRGLAGRTGRALATADDVARHDEPMISVERATGADQPLPPARRRMSRTCLTRHVAVTGQGVLNHDRVVARGVEGPPRLIGNPHLREGSSGFEPKAADIHVAARPLRGPFTPGSGRPDI